LTIAYERLDESSDSKMRGLLDALGQRGEVRTARHAKEVLRSAHDHGDAATALEFVTRLGVDLQDDTCRPRPTGSAARSAVGAIRSQPDIAVGTRTGRPKPSRTSSSGSRSARQLDDHDTRTLLLAGRPRWNLLTNSNPR
jgi:hypothetical protein